jgi:tripartite-type tricarboxylate transporter receptor subunit TctC
MALLKSLCAAAALAPALALAQAPWPAHAITLVVPYTAGGSVDYNARLVAQRLSERLKQPVIIDNIGGAGGAVGLAKAAAAAPDGYTFVAGTDSAVAIGKLVNPAAYHFDPLQLAPVGMLNTAPLVLVAGPRMAAKTYAEFVQQAKAQPGRLTYATSGVGTVLQLAMELLKERSGIYVTHVPYRGGGQIATDVIGGQVDVAMLVSTTAIPQITGGRMHALGVTSPVRLDALPQVPALGELPGLKGYSMVSWTGIFAPAGTPPAIVKRLNEELNAVLKEPAIAGKLREQGAVPGTGSAEDLGRFVHTEYDRYQKIVRAANIKE